MSARRSEALTQPVRLLLWPQWLPVAAELHRPLCAVKDYFHRGSCRGMSQLHSASSGARFSCACCTKPPTCVMCLTNRVSVRIRMGLTNELVLHEWLDSDCTVWSLLTQIRKRIGRSRMRMKLMTHRSEIIDDKLLTMTQLLEANQSRLCLRLVLNDQGCSHHECPGMIRTRVMRCAGCMDVVYCGRSCQKAHWSVHKFDCKRQVVESD